MQAEHLEKPQKVLLDPSKEKFRENKSEYFTYYANVASSFKKDLETFIIRFERLKSFSFRSFARIWQNMNFSLVFAGQEFLEEEELFMETSFFTVMKYIIFSESIYVQVGAFYMLYALYFKQRCREKIRIRISPDEYSAFASLVQKMEEREVKEFVGIFNKLKCLRAFHFIARPRRYGLEGKFMWQEKKLKNDIFPSSKTLDPINEVTKALFSPEFYGFAYLNKNNQDYVEGLRKYGIINSSDDRPTLIVRDLESTYGKLTMKFEESNQSNMNTKRLKIKNKSYATEVPALRTIKSETTSNE